MYRSQEEMVSSITDTCRYKYRYRIEYNIIDRYRSQEGMVSSITDIYCFRYRPAADPQYLYTSTVVSQTVQYTCTTEQKLVPLPNNKCPEFSNHVF